VIDRKELDQWLLERDLHAWFFKDQDNAIVGMTWDLDWPVVVYDMQVVLDNLVKKSGMTPQEARETIEKDLLVETGGKEGIAPIRMETIL